MRFGSVCSGIGAPEVAWRTLGWECAFGSEIEPFPRAVYNNRFPYVPLHGDFTTIGADDYGPIDLLVAGTPCQDFSTAGLRAGLTGDRGRLTIEFVNVLKRKKPRWFVWENVPGVLSADGGGAFGIFLGALAECGYGFAYRVLDAQHFGVPQRRRRVFVVGYLGDWRRAAAVLFERGSLYRHSPPSRKAGQGATRGVEIGPSGGGFTDISPTLAARCKDGPIRNQLAPAAIQTVGTLMSSGAGMERPAGMASETDFLVAFTCKDSGGDSSEMSPTLRAMGGVPNGGGQVAVATTSAVRRLTPRECERLQGFPDDFTLVPFRKKDAADGLRYRALGNSMAVPVLRWIGERVAFVESLAH